MDADTIRVNDGLHKYCVSYITVQVVNTVNLAPISSSLESCVACLLQMVMIVQCTKIVSYNENLNECASDVR